VEPASIGLSQRRQLNFTKKSNIHDKLSHNQLISHIKKPEHQNPQSPKIQKYKNTKKQKNSGMSQKPSRRSL
jgi:hypothetical protein